MLFSSNYIVVPYKFSFFISSKEYISEDPPRMVLDKLDQKGYKVITATGVGQTLVWTLYKDGNYEI